MDMLIEFIIACIIKLLPLIIFMLAFCVKRVPKNTVYIIDKHTHYCKTVKNGYFYLNPVSHKITTKISTSPITITYSEIFETHDGLLYSVPFQVTYSTKNMEDVLYNLEKVRRSIDDIFQSCMYGAVRSLSKKSMTRATLEETFRSNLESEAMSIGIDIDNFYIDVFSPVIQNYVKPFKPHKNYSNAGDPIQFF